MPPPSMLTHPTRPPPPIPSPPQQARNKDFDIYVGLTPGCIDREPPIRTDLPLSPPNPPYTYTPSAGPNSLFVFYGRTVLPPYRIVLPVPPPVFLVQAT